MAAVVTRTLAIDHEAVGITAVGENRQIDRRAVRLAKHHVAATGSLNGVRSPDDEIGQAVAIDVAGCRKRIAVVVTRTLAVDHEAFGRACHSN